MAGAAIWAAMIANNAWWRICARARWSIASSSNNRTGANGAGHETVRLRSRTFRVDAADDLLVALRDLVGADGVQLVKA